MLIDGEWARPSLLCSFFKRARVWFTEVGCEDKGGGQADSADKSGKGQKASRSAAAAQEGDGSTLQSWQPWNL